jgi:hypothetical protein
MTGQDALFLAAIFVFDAFLFLWTFPKIHKYLRLLGTPPDELTKYLQTLKGIANKGDVARFISELHITAREMNPRRRNHEPNHSASVPVMLVINDVFQSLTKRLPPGEHETYAHITPRVLENRFAPTLSDLIKSWKFEDFTTMCKALATMDALSLKGSEKDYFVREESISQLSDALIAVARATRRDENVEGEIGDLVLEWNKILERAGKRIDPLVILTIDVLKESIAVIPVADVRYNRVKEMMILVGLYLEALGKALRTERLDEILEALSDISLVFHGELV